MHKQEQIDNLALQNAERRMPNAEWEESQDGFSPQKICQKES